MIPLAAISTGLGVVSQLSSLFGGREHGPDVILGLAHPAVDQDRLRSDPLYAEAVRRADAEHRAQQGGRGWLHPQDEGGGSLIADVQRDIERHLAAITPAPAPAALRAAPLLAAALPTSFSSRSTMNGFNGFAANGNGFNTSSAAPIPDFGPITQQPTWAGVALQGLNLVMQDRLAREQAKGFSVPSTMAAPGMSRVAFPLALGPMLGGAARVGASAMGLMGLGGLLRGAARRRAVKLAKIIGVQAAATALGIGAVELADAILAEQSKARRGRGVTAAQIRTTKRTMRTVMGLHRDMVRSCSSAGFRTRRSAPRACPPQIVVKK